MTNSKGASFAEYATVVAGGMLLTLATITTLGPEIRDIFYLLEEPAESGAASMAQPENTIFVASGAPIIPGSPTDPTSDGSTAPKAWQPDPMEADAECTAAPSRFRRDPSTEEWLNTLPDGSAACAPSGAKWKNGCWIIPGYDNGPAPNSIHPKFPYWSPKTTYEDHYVTLCPGISGIHYLYPEYKGFHTGNWGLTYHWWGDETKLYGYHLLNPFTVDCVPPLSSGLPGARNFSTFAGGAGSSDGGGFACQ